MLFLHYSFYIIVANLCCQYEEFYQKDDGVFSFSRCQVAMSGSWVEARRVKLSDLVCLCMVGGSRATSTCYAQHPGARSQYVTVNYTRNTSLKDVSIFLNPGQERELWHKPGTVASTSCRNFPLGIATCKATFRDY